VHPSRRPTPRRAAGPIAAGLAAALLAAAAPTARAQDLTFSYRVQSAAAARADAAGQQAPAPNMLATVRMSGGNGRIDMREGVMPMTGPGGYILLAAPSSGSCSSIRRSAGRSSSPPTPSAPAPARSPTTRS
jgi:hypothetical protein